MNWFLLAVFILSDIGIYYLVRTFVRFVRRLRKTKEMKIKFNSMLGDDHFDG